MAAPPSTGSCPRPSIADHAPLSWAIFSLTRAHAGYAGDLLREAGLHPGQEFLLMLLFDRGEQLQSELLAAVGLDHSTLSKSLRRMQETGLVTRRPADHDRRAMIVTLTEKGEALRDRLITMLETLETASAASFDAESRDALIADLSGIESNVTRCRAERAWERIHFSARS